jgi:putative resolvase
MKELLTLSEASQILGVTTTTLRNWDNAGKIQCLRTSGNHRRIPKNEIQKLLGSSDNSTMKTLVYCRCSTNEQNDNLERQIGRVLEYCSLHSWNTELYKDIGSGLNENRKAFKKLLKQIQKDDVIRVVAEYKDRIVRYGFKIFQEYCNSHDVEIVIIREDKNKTFEEEMTNDIISIVTSYSVRYYGRRGGRKNAD